jgi:hypothetical protein
MLESLLAVLVGAGGKLYSKRSAIVYALVCILAFWLIYQLMGMKKHFDVPEYLAGRERSWLTSLYTSVLAQSNAMPDTTPKTDVARALFMLQVTLGWMWFLVLA